TRSRTASRSATSGPERAAARGAGAPPPLRVGAGPIALVASAPESGGLMLEPDDLGPVLPVLRPRRAWVGAVALVMVLTLVLFPYDWAGTAYVDTDCPSPLVRDLDG